MFLQSILRLRKAAPLVWKTPQDLRAKRQAKGMKKSTRGRKNWFGGFSQPESSTSPDLYAGMRTCIIKKEGECIKFADES